MSPTPDQSDSPTGPENPRGPSGPDAPAPPGGPLRSDAPAGSTSPGGPEQSGDDPWLDDPETGSGTGSGSAPPQAGDGASYPAPDGETHARTQTEQANEELQQENAETALDQPSDGSGGE